MLKWPSAVVIYGNIVFKCTKIFLIFLASPPAPLQQERGVVCSRGHKVEMAFIMSQSQWSGAAVGADFISVRSPERANVIYRRYNRYWCMGVLLHTTPLSRRRGAGGEAVFFLSSEAIFLFYFSFIIRAIHYYAQQLMNNYMAITCFKPFAEELPSIISP